jgi:hypothetical protein
MIRGTLEPRLASWLLHREQEASMDRSDEKNQRAGDILGLGDVVAGDTTTPPATADAEEIRKRRARMQEGADDVAGVSNDTPRGAGATGIDMGAGGDGTDIE